MRGLYVGIRTPGTTSQLRADTLVRQASAIHWTVIDTDPPYQQASRLSRSLWFRLRTGPAVWRLNKLVMQQSGTDRFDLIWIDKGVCLWPSTIRHLRKLTDRLIYYTPDTSFFDNSSRFFDATIGLYDLVVTTKSFESAAFLERIPASRLLLVTQSYDATLHYPRCRFEDKLPEAVIIGLCETDREDCVDRLLNCGISVRVGGRGWSAFVNRHSGNPLLAYEGERVFGDRYAEVLSRAAVGLGLLTRRFPELHTTRTLEIPACGTVLATERNEETASLFSDDEALFFSDYADLSTRVSSLLADLPRLRAVSEAGRERTIRSGYSNDSVMRMILSGVGLQL